MPADYQTPLALVIVALAAGGLVWSAWKRRRRPGSGCGSASAGCGCTTGPAARLAKAARRR